MNETTNTSRPKLSEGRFLLALVILPFCVRLFLLVTQECITKDAPVYLDVAQLMTEGEYALALKQGYQPLYPALIALVHAVVGDWILAGGLVSILCSAFAVIPLALIVKHLFGGANEWRPVAVLCSFLYATIPVPTQLSSEIFSTGCYLLFFLLAYWFILRGLAAYRWYDFALATLAIVCAYMVRPDALALIPLLIVWIVAVNVGRFRENGKRMAIAIGVVLGTFLLLASPYLIHSLKTRGLGEMLTAKLSIVIEHRDGGGAWSALADIGGSLAATFFYWPILLLLPGLIKRKIFKSPRAIEGFVLVSALVFLGVIVWLGVTRGYSSKRHMVPIVVLLLPWVAVGFIEIFARWKAMKWISLVAILAVLTFVPKTFRPLGYDKVGEREAGEWMRENVQCGPGEAMTTAIRPYFYAFETIRQLREFSVDHARDRVGDYEGLIVHMRANGRKYLIADDSIEALDPAFVDRAQRDPRWEQIFATSKRSDRRESKDMIYIFRLADEPMKR